MLFAASIMKRSESASHKDYIRLAAINSLNNSPARNYEPKGGRYGDPEEGVQYEQQVPRLNGDILKNLQLRRSESNR